MKNFAIAGLNAINLMISKVDASDKEKIACALSDGWSLSACITGSPETRFDIHLDLVKGEKRLRVATLEPSEITVH